MFNQLKLVYEKEEYVYKNILAKKVIKIQRLVKK